MNDKLRIYANVPRCMYLGYQDGKLVCRKNTRCDSPCNANISLYTLEHPEGHWMARQPDPKAKASS